MKIMLADRKDQDAVAKAGAIPVCIARINPLKDLWYKNWYQSLAPHSYMLAMPRKERSHEYYRHLMSLNLADIFNHMKTGNVVYSI